MDHADDAGSKPADVYWDEGQRVCTGSCSLAKALLMRLKLLGLYDHLGYYRPTTITAKRINQFSILQLAHVVDVPFRRLLTNHGLERESMNAAEAIHSNTWETIHGSYDR